MTVEEKANELNCICDRYYECSDCPIERVFPVHKCGNGKDYDVHNKNCVSEDEINKICALLNIGEREEDITMKIIKEVNILVPNKVVEVTFVDGDKQKAVCQEPDVFNLEQAVSICLTKHLLGGTGAYNKAVKNGIKVYEENQREKWRIKAEEERIARRRAKKAAYMKRRAEKRREEQIEIQKEAYVRAMREVSVTSN